MPWQNRVTPDGDLVAVPDRGTLTGNRGVLHDADGRIVRRSQNRRWIACLLDFRGRTRTVMTPGRWTNLFFLDEATALAAGHRPCAECRRSDYVEFRRCWTAALDLPALPGADDLDDVLHRERALVDGRRTTWSAPGRDLPDGAMVQLDGAPWLVADGRLHRWSHSGYSDRTTLPGGRLDVLTPASVVATLRAGYRAGLHPTAGASPRTAT